MFRMGKLKKLISLIVLLGALSVPMRSFSEGKTEMNESEVMLIAEEIGGKYNICPAFLTAIAFQESSYNPKAECEGCIGLMQVSPKWHAGRMERLGVSDLNEPYGNMLVAADYLLELFREYEDPAMVLEVYNGDSGAEAYWNGEASMSDYANDILFKSQELERKYEKENENVRENY